MINSKNEYIKMDGVEGKHWWYKSLHKLVLNSIESNFNSKEINILDAGCGTGGLLEYLRSKNYNNISGYDLSKDAVELSNQKGLNTIELDLIDYQNTDKKYDVIISNDTMYFFNLEEQKRILDEFYLSLNRGGILILNLPSFNAFGGIHDKAVGVENRFNAKMVDDMIDNDKFEIIQKTYWPFLLSPLIYLVRLAQRVQLKNNSNVRYVSDIDVPPEIINNTLYSIITLENKYIKRKPFGSSLFLVLRAG